MNPAVRIAVASLSLSFAGFLGLAVHESYVGEAMVPTKNDRPTIGFGSTFNADGTPVKMGDRTTPVRALITAAAHISKSEEQFRASLPGVKMHQAEYDTALDFVYQYGIDTWLNSSMRRELLAGNYVAACNAYLRYRFAGGYDCSTPGNKRCWGVWTRQKERFDKCMAAQ